MVGSLNIKTHDGWVSDFLLLNQVLAQNVDRGILHLTFLLSNKVLFEFFFVLLVFFTNLKQAVLNLLGRLRSFQRFLPWDGRFRLVQEFGVFPQVVVAVVFFKNVGILIRVLPHFRCLLIRLLPTCVRENGPRNLPLRQTLFHLHVVPRRMPLILLFNYQVFLKALFSLFLIYFELQSLVIQLSHFHKSLSCWKRPRCFLLFNIYFWRLIPFCCLLEIVIWFYLIYQWFIRFNRTFVGLSLFLRLIMTLDFELISDKLGYLVRILDNELFSKTNDPVVNRLNIQWLIVLHEIELTLSIFERINLMWFLPTINSFKRHEIFRIDCGRISCCQDHFFIVDIWSCIESCILNYLLLNIPYKASNFLNIGPLSSTLIFIVPPFERSEAAFHLLFH